jgi:hypothetical protein
MMSFCPFDKFLNEGQFCSAYLGGHKEIVASRKIFLVFFMISKRSHNEYMIGSCCAIDIFYNHFNLLGRKNRSIIIQVHILSWTGALARMGPGRAPICPTLWAGGGRVHSDV